MFMPGILKRVLNSITMYRLMLYYLLLLWATSVILSFAGYLPYNPVDILLSGVYLGVVCNLANYFLAKIFKARANLESASITALILSLIFGPLALSESLFALTFVGVVCMASKYVLAIKKKHIFNPAALGVFLSAIFINSGASWWGGSIYTLSVVILGGLLVLTKIKRFGLVGSFLLIYFLGKAFLSGNFTINSFLAPPVWFFAFVMLVEPLTSPSTRNKQVIFGAAVALSYVFLPRIIPGYAYGLETALLLGNLLNLALSPSFNLVLTLREKKKVAQDTWDFYFEPMSKFTFTSGQYLEWTLPHKNPDSRGFRRYFTISSSPEEKQVMLTTRVAEKGSSFKSALMNLKVREELVASSPQGDFVLPKDKTIPLAFIAGGIGVTPFRGMVNHLLAKDEKRDIVLLFSNKEEKEIAFKELFEKAKDAGVKTFYINTTKDGHIDEEMIREKISDYQKRTFYISGPQLMVEAIGKMLLKMNVAKIKTDLFPGYAETQ